MINRKFYGHSRSAKKVMSHESLEKCSNFTCPHGHSNMHAQMQPCTILVGMSKNDSKIVTALENSFKDFDSCAINKQGKTDYQVYNIICMHTCTTQTNTNTCTNMDIHTYTHPYSPTEMTSD